MTSMDLILAWSLKNLGGICSSDLDEVVVMTVLK